MHNSWKKGRKTEAKYTPMMDVYYNLSYCKWKTIHNPIIQKGLGIDRIAFTVTRKLKCEDKYVNDRAYDRVFIEEYQNTRARKSIGWIVESKADILHYILCNDTRLRVLHFNLPLLKRWYLENRNKYTIITVEDYDTWPRGRLVPIKDFPKDIMFEEGVYTYGSTT